LAGGGGNDCGVAVVYNGNRGPLRLGGGGGGGDSNIWGGDCIN
jgi:hypothetical protein